MRPFRALAPLLLLLALLPALALAKLSQHAKEQHRLAVSPLLWATVNFCDSTHHRREMGVRVSMPGTYADSRDSMYARLRVEYFRTARPRGWHLVTGHAGDSGWLYLGSARRRARQTGYRFVFDPQGFRFRAVASFRWARAGRVSFRAQELTSAGHHGAAGAEPPGYSTRTCVIRVRKKKPPKP